MTPVFFLILAAVVALGFALVAALRPNPARQRLIRLADRSRVRRPSFEQHGLIDDERPRWSLRLLGALAGRSARSAGHVPNRLSKRLIEAGFRRPSALTVFMGGRVALALACPLLLMLTPMLWHLDQLRLVALLGIATGFGYLFPSYYVDRRRTSRQRAIEHGLPDALDLMVVCVQAGLGIVASIDRVVRDLGQSNPVLSAEFELTVYEIRAGKSTVDALRSLVHRTGVSEISALVAMLIQTERFGTSIADTLRVHADSLRTRRMQRAEELASKAPLKMLFPTGLIFTATLVVTIGPAVYQIADFFTKR